MMMRPMVSLLVPVLLACAPVDTIPDAWPPGAQAVSLTGDTLYSLPLSPEVLATRERQLTEAREAYEANPDDADALIWLGRRTAYLGRFREAIEVFSGGVGRFPTDARLYRHRGHRYLTTRQLTNAIADLRYAAELIEGSEDEVEPDGLPNAQGVPTGTLHTNIFYHLGMAHYLRYDYESALSAYRRCLAASGNDDMRVATLYWLYLTLEMLGRNEEAADALTEVTADMNIIENDAYHRLLLMYKGELSLDEVAGGDTDALASATIGYGVAMSYVIQGSREAEARLRDVVAGSEWPAFGYIAAESMLVELQAR